MIARLLPHSSLQARLIAYMLLILAGSAALLACYISYSLRTDLRQQLGEEQLGTVALVATEINTALDLKLRALEGVTAEISADMLGDSVALQAFLEARLALQPAMVAGIVAVGATGITIAQAPGGTERLLQAGGDVAQLLAQLEHQGRAIGTPQAVPGAMSPQFAVAVPIRDERGTLAGALVSTHGLIDSNFIAHVIESHYGSGDGLVLVAPVDDISITLRADEAAVASRPGPDIESVLGQNGLGTEGTRVVVNPSGVEVLASVKSIPVAGWQVIAQLPTAHAFAVVNEMMRRTVLGTLLLTLVSGFLVQRVLQHELAPMRSATDALPAMSASDDSAQVLPVARLDEIGALIGGFNGVLRTLRNREQALRESEDRYRLLVDSAAEAIFVTQDDHIRFFNPALVGVLECTEQQLIAARFTEFVHAESRELAQARQQLPLEGAHSSGRYAIRIQTRFGAEKWLEIGGVQIVWDGAPAVLNFAVEITEKRQIKLALAQASELLDRTSELANIGGWRLDLESQRLQWSPGTYRIHELDSQATPTMTQAFDYFAPEGRAKIEAAIQASLVSGATWDLELPMVTAKGRSILVRMQGVLELDGEKVVALWGTIQDVTARRQMEKQILQSEKLAAIGQLAAGIAHEINNPIAFVNSNLHALEKYTQDLLAVIAAYESVANLSGRPGLPYAAVDAVCAQVELDYLKKDLPALLSESADGLERVKSIVLGLKDFARADASEDWQRSDLRKGIESTLKVVWNELKYKCEVRTEFAELPPVECLLGQLNQVFMNLLVNAAHAIVEHGVICVRTGRVGNEVWVEVVDSGIGMTPAVVSRIFDPFFTTSEVGRGTGLGLSVSLGIVQRHHGRIDVETEPGKGSTFRVWLPITQPRGPVTSA